MTINPNAPFGMTTRPALSTPLNFPLTVGRPTGTVSAVRAFTSLPTGSGGLQFPVAMAPLPGWPGWIAVVQQTGQIRVFDQNNATSLPTFLNIASRITAFGELGEEGLLGLAFDPGFATNGFFYVYYSVAGSGRGHDTVVERYQSNLPAAGRTPLADPASAIRILTIDQPDEPNHKAGALHFGPDGMLYISVGDGGNDYRHCDPLWLNASSGVNPLLGKILRIQVNTNGTYSIPSDNPFASNGKGTGGEIWAYGFRNPFRMSFDGSTLWVGDVGDSAQEEVNIVQRGGNYGWPLREGTGSHYADCSGGPGVTAAINPILVHTQAEGHASVIGGVVYRGTQVPSLQGLYLHADHVSRYVWATDYNPTTRTEQTRHLFTLQPSNEGPAAFGIDHQNEVYMLSVMTGSIWRFQETNSTPGTNPMPTELSDTGVFNVQGNGLFAATGTLTPNSGLIEYSVRVPLWSDGSTKKRWIYVPGTDRIRFNATDAWSFPTGTVLVKHFELPVNGTPRRVETRVLVNHTTGWAGYTYRWNDAQTEATLLTTNQTATIGGISWTFPTVSCMQCHTAGQGTILGPRTRQLNGDHAYGSVTDNQLRTWNRIGLFANSAGAALDIGSPANYRNYPSWPSSPQQTVNPASLKNTARAYLAVNCAHCHSPGAVRPSMDFNYSTALGSAGVLGASNGNRIIPGGPDQSELFLRMQSTDPNFRMPRIGSVVPDPTALSVIRAWINGL